MRRSSIVLFLVAGCTTQAPRPGPSPAVATTPPGPSLALRHHMRVSYDLVRGIERLVIRGRLEEARSFARAIAVAPDAAGLEAYAEHTRLVRERATALASATLLDEACRRDAWLIAACASCHVATRATPRFDDHPPEPANEPAVAARMARHRWATERLWEGFVGGGEAAWSAGLRVLADAPLTYPQLSPELVEQAGHLQRLAAAAHERTTPAPLAERAVIYGEILTTCAACHTRTWPAK